MSARYPSMARRKQVGKARDAEMKRSLEEAAGYLPDPSTAPTPEPTITGVVSGRGHISFTVDQPGGVTIYFTDLNDGALRFWSGQSAVLPSVMVRVLGEQLISWADRNVGGAA